MLVPLAVLLVEPSRRRQLAMAPFLAIGVAAGGYLFWIDVAHPVAYRVVNHSIVYDNTGSLVVAASVLYVIATCGAALFSGYRWLVVFGVANVVALAVTGVILASSFTSVWCAAAAVLSVLLLVFFRRQLRGEHPGAARVEAAAHA